MYSGEKPSSISFGLGRILVLGENSLQSMVRRMEDVGNNLVE